MPFDVFLFLRSSFHEVEINISNHWAINEPRQRTALGKSDPACGVKLQIFYLYSRRKTSPSQEKVIYFNFFLIDSKCLSPTRISAPLIALFPPI